MFRFVAGFPSKFNFSMTLKLATVLFLREPMHKGAFVQTVTREELLLCLLGDYI